MISSCKHNTHPNRSQGVSATHVPEFFRSAKKLELPRVGNQYVLGEEEITIIRDALGHKPTGRPRKSMNDEKN